MRSVYGGAALDKDRTSVFVAAGKIIMNFDVKNAPSATKDDISLRRSGNALLIYDVFVWCALICGQVTASGYRSRRTLSTYLLSSNNHQSFPRDEDT